MKYLENEPLTLHYQPGNGAWTYHIIIPQTKGLRGKWGELKVSGTIDGHPIKNKNLAPIKGNNKRLAINSEIRKAIGKTAGDKLVVTLYLENQTHKETIPEILACFKDADVFQVFQELSNLTKEKILQKIRTAETEEQKTNLILAAIQKLENEAL